MTDPAFKAKLYASFAIVYIAWGSTFLAIRLGVQDLPPLLFAAGRSFLAGVLLLAIALYRRETWPTTRREWLIVFLFGLVMISLSNGASTYALKHLPSNEVALLNSSLALWIAGFGTLGPKGQSLHARSVAGLLLGFAGVALLVVREGIRFDAHFGWQMLTVGGCMVWAAATIVFRNMTLATGAMAFNALLMWFGGFGLLAGGIVAGDLPEWHWDPRWLWAMLYLAVFGSALTYTAYSWLLKNVRTDRVATFAYVNPAIATLLGWLVLGETLSPQQMLGMLVILAGVALVTLPRRSG
jgi:drug/metabolite transporter (DMT)-like permease